MKVVFKINIPQYQTNCFPENLTTPPRIGDSVLVNQIFREYYSKKNLPILFEVVDVIHTEIGIVCELDFKKKL